MLYITGITGHSGGWLLQRLNKEKYKDKICCSMRKSKDEDPEKYKIFEGLDLDLEFAVGDLKDREFLLKFLGQNSETDYAAASKYGKANENEKDSDKCKKSNPNMENVLIHTAGIDKSALIMEIAAISGIDRAILVHTTGRFSKYKSASEIYIKIEDDILAKENYPHCTILRPTMIYGSSKDRNMYRLVGFLNKFPAFPVFGDGSNLMQPVHARDLGNAYYDVLMNPQKTINKQYDLSGKDPIQYIDIVRYICKCLGRKTKLVKIPLNLSVLAAKAYNGIFGSKAIISVEQVLRMNEDKIFSHEKASKDFGYDPLSFYDGIKGEVEEFLSGVRVDFSEVKYR